MIILLTNDLTLTACFERYRITEGDGQTWIRGSQALSFRANGPLKSFTQPVVDGQILDSAYWSAASGSTILTLNKAFLSGLREGQHTLKLQYSNGETQTVTFTVKNKKTPDTGDSFSPWLWMILVCLSGAGTIMLCRRHKCH